MYGCGSKEGHKKMNECASTAVQAAFPRPSNGLHATFQRPSNELPLRDHHLSWAGHPSPGRLHSPPPPPQYYPRLFGSSTASQPLPQANTLQFPCTPQGTHTGSSHAPPKETPSPRNPQEPEKPMYDPSTRILWIAMCMCWALPRARSRPLRQCVAGLYFTATMSTKKAGGGIIKGLSWQWDKAAKLYTGTSTGPAGGGA